jgi:hypothetical protein
MYGRGLGKQGQTGKPMPDPQGQASMTRLLPAKCLTLRVRHWFTGSQNQSCQTGVTFPGNGGSRRKSTLASPGAWKSVPREARKP